MLTGKAKENFKQWIFKEYGRSVADILYFEDILKYALYIDFFDSVGIYIEKLVDYDDKNRHYCQGIMVVNGKGVAGFETDSFNTRPEATKAAILKANKIYNSKNG